MKINGLSVEEGAERGDVLHVGLGRARQKRQPQMLSQGVVGAPPTGHPANYLEGLTYPEDQYRIFREKIYTYV